MQGNCSLKDKEPNLRVNDAGCVVPTWCFFLFLWGLTAWKMCVPKRFFLAIHDKFMSYFQANPKNWHVPSVSWISNKKLCVFWDTTHIVAEASSATWRAETFIQLSGPKVSLLIKYDCFIRPAVSGGVYVRGGRLTSHDMKDSHSGHYAGPKTAMFHPFCFNMSQVCLHNYPMSRTENTFQWSNGMKRLQTPS